MSRNKDEERVYPHTKRSAMRDGAFDWEPKPGISLRDHFAGQALAGLVGRVGWSPEDNARHAYAAADAMLVERKRASE